VVRHFVRHAAQHEPARAAHASAADHEHVGGVARHCMHVAPDALAARVCDGMLAHSLGFSGGTPIHCLHIDGCVVGLASKVCD
jgi:hypothetical protein